MSTRPQRLEVFDLSLGSANFADEWGDRPCVVISHNFYNDRLATVVVVTFTSQDRSADSGCVRVKRAAVTGVTGLNSDSWAVCHSPQTVPQEALASKRGHLTDRATIVAIESAMAFSLELGPDPEDGF